MMTNDLDADIRRHYEEEDSRHKRLPKCDCCHDTIDDEDYYDINGEILCYECLNKKYRRWTSDYVEDEKWKKN